MADAKNGEATSTAGPRNLRLWPGVAIVTLQAVGILVVPAVAPDVGAYGLIGAALGTLLVLVWWLFFSRAPWSERLGALGLMSVAGAVTYQLVDKSLSNGMMGLLLGFYLPPLLCLGLVVWAAASRGLTGGPRWLALTAAVVLSCVPVLVVRTGGFTGDLEHEWAWRWSPTPEDRLLAATQGEALAAPAAAAPSAATEPATAPADPASEPGSSTLPAPTATAAAAATSTAAAAVSATSPDAATAAPPAPDTPAPDMAAAAATTETPGEGDLTATVADLSSHPAAPAAPAAATTAQPIWPGFRGASRNSVIHAAPIATDWAAAKPAELWRRPVGPGWSSFAVAGPFFYTQEQRGEDEVVACYRLADGEPVWRHSDPVRFWESNGGAGPRATPTLYAGKVYSLGATGVLNALDAATGAHIWSRDAVAETGAEIPGWGISGSPLVTEELVIVAVSGWLAAFDRTTGERRWSDQGGGASYSSPQLVTLGGVEQVLLQRGKGVVSVTPTDGTLLWQHEWPSVSIVQPGFTADGDLLVSDNDSGVRRLAVAAGTAGWTLTESWTTIGLKPYFSDYVVHGGHAYGFDGSHLAAIDLATGQRAWKGGRYGNGQLILLADQDLLVVISEKGELGLVGATPDAFRELGRFPAITGKTWNHPVLAGDVLLVRNDREMAAFRLQPAGG